jgi:hypothetical protein
MRWLAVGVVHPAGAVLGAATSHPDTQPMDFERLRRRLARVCRRLGEELPYSPSWAASMDELEELAREIGIEPNVVAAGRYLAAVDVPGLLAV